MKNFLTSMSLKSRYNTNNMINKLYKKTFSNKLIEYRINNINLNIISNRRFSYNRYTCNRAFGAASGNTSNSLLS